MSFNFNYRSLLWTLLRWFAGVFFKSFLSWLYWWWFHYLSLYCLFPTLGLRLQAEGLGLPCLLEVTVVACEEPIYWLRCLLELTIFRTLAEPFLQIFVEKAWSPTSLVQGRTHPLWGTWICSQGPARHRKKILSSNPSEPEARHSNGSEPDGYQTSYQARCIDRTNRTKQKREALFQSVSCGTHVNTHLHTSVLFVFSLTIRASSSITSTITSRARSSITLTLFTRSLSVDGRVQLRCRRIWSSCSCPFPLLRPLHR